MAIALLLAAGRGERLGSDVPKAFVMLGGRPMLQWSIDALRAVDAVDEIVIALPESREAPPDLTGVRGGATRSESVRAALSVAGPGDPVLVHDAARPLLTPELIARVLDAAGVEGVDGAIASAPVTDTIKRVDASRRVLETLDRSALWAVQTPQVFDRGVLERALDAGPERLAAVSDDASLVEQAGATVIVVPWAQENVKVTTHLDLRLAEQVLRARGDADAH